MNKHTTDRAIVKEIIIRAPIRQVWQAWTTADGLESFFTRRAQIELRTDGPYELLFFPDNPVGQRGEEGA